MSHNRSTVFIPRLLLAQPLTLGPLSSRSTHPLSLSHSGGGGHAPAPRRRLPSSTAPPPNPDLSPPPLIPSLLLHAPLDALEPSRPASATGSLHAPLAWPAGASCSAVLCRTFHRRMPTQPYLKSHKESTSPWHPDRAAIPASSRRLAGTPSCSRRRRPVRLAERCASEKPCCPRLRRHRSCFRGSTPRAGLLR